MKKKILFVAPASIPVFSAESIVNVKLLSALIDAGYQIDVISKKNKWINYPESDFYLTDRLNSLNIIAVDNSLTLKTIWLHFLSLVTFGVVYRGSHWAYKALQYIKKHIDVSVYDAVITKNGPAELVGYWLKKHKGLKWIATWNDPFPKNCYPYPYGSGPVRQPWYMRKLITIMRDWADYSVIPSDRLYHYMDKYVHFHEDRVRIIPHVALDDKRHNKLPDGRLRILVSGNNKKPRNPIPLINAFVRVVNSEKIGAELVFVGGVDDDVNMLVRSINVNNCVKIQPAVSYEESMDMLKNYDLAILIEAACDEGIFLPTKIVDFMQVGIPVMSISPLRGVLNDMYKNGNIGYFADCTDEYAIEKEINKIFQDYSNKSLKGVIIPNNFLSEHIVEEYNKII